MRSPLLLAALLGVFPALAQDPAEVAAGKGDPKETPQQALQKFSVAPGLRVDLWAAEPLLQNPVAFSFDEHGRAFVAETFRRRTSAPDIRAHMEWLLPDLALRTVEDREAFLKKTLAPELHLKPTKNYLDHNGDGQFDWRDWAVESERIKLVEGTAGRPVANTATVLADDFAGLTTGTAAGVLAQGGQIWYSAIPDLWHLSPADGKAEKLLTGFGVHVAYGGHDMHGVKMGPDGRIYWTIADCGAHVVTKEGTVIDNPDSGAVFRANPDGTEMELFAKGLRNPQSLAFNDFGDLFTGDNNADGGDKARWEHIVEGGDYGWRIGWQFLSKLGAWNSEGLWQMDAGETALSILPPTGLVGHGPAGIAYYPGTGLPDSYHDHFLMADFPGGVRSFALERHGASYRVALTPELAADNRANVLEGKLLWGLSPSDVQFGVDGGAYVLDWVRGWEKTGQGRIWRVHDPATDAGAVVRDTKQLLAEGMAERSDAELAELLCHPDQRVRMAAQFALVAGKRDGTLTMAADGNPLTAAQAHAPTIARLHAIWGLAQLGRLEPRYWSSIADTLKNADDAEVRAQAAKALGESRDPYFAPQLTRLAADPAPRVRFYAVQALGKLHQAHTVPAIVEFFRKGVGSDPYLRHAGALALSQCAEPSVLAELAHDASDSVRTGALLALRRQHRPEVAGFLEDSSPQLVLEAARAIHDEPIEEAMPRLAALLGQANLPLPVALRAVNACYRLGGSPDELFYAVLGKQQSAAAVVVDMLEAITAWNTDPGRDRVLGVYRPYSKDRFAKSWHLQADRLALSGCLRGGPEAVGIAGVKLIMAAGLTDFNDQLLMMVKAEKDTASLRAAALQALIQLNADERTEALNVALQAKDAALVKEARLLAGKGSSSAALEQARAGLASGKPAELQGAFLTLGDCQGTEADQLLVAWLEQLSAGKVPPAARLDLLEAAGKRTDPAVQAKLAAWQNARPADDPLGKWSECLEGGDAALGRQVFAEKAEAACLRCHKFAGTGGEVGPDLAGIGKKHDRAYILRSIVAPNADIAAGYENVLLTLKDGNMTVGIKTAETAEAITLQPLTGGPKETVPKEKVAKTDKVPSPMPEGLAEILGKRDLRNVVEFLFTAEK